jgi:DNA polymerase-3 subunit delta'
MRFDSIKGQDRAVNVIKSYIKSARVGAGYIFCGPDSVGKKMAAFAMAAALNCESQGMDACGECPSCRKIENGWHPDVHLTLSEDSMLKIEDIRLLQKEISLKPYEGRFKVFIIDSAHNLTAEAANCLLKVLEEPPPLSLIILITDKPQKLFKTILSRCKTVKFSSLNRKELKDILEHGYGLNHSLAHFLAYFCEGRLGETLRLKDTDILSEKNTVIDKLAVSPGARTEGFTVEEKKQFRFAINILAAWFRDLYILKSGMGEEEAINCDRIPDLLSAAKGYTFPDLERIFNCLSSTSFYLERNINNRLLLHNLKVQICQR